MAKEAKVDYDKEHDILYFYLGEKVKDSLEIDNYVIDFSADNKVVGVEIFNASSFVGKLIGFPLNKENLSNILSAKIQFSQGKELFYISIFFVLKIKNKIKELSLQVPSPKAVMIGAS